MSDAVLIPAGSPRQPATAPISWSAIAPWVAFGALAVLAIYFVGVEEGATSIFSGMYVHEFLHDARHLLGFPCH